jgi:hypothetical protein
MDNAGVSCRTDEYLKAILSDAGDHVAIGVNETSHWFTENVKRVVERLTDIAHRERLKKLIAV